MKELEMILAAVAQLGDASKEAFIWWLMMDKGLSFIALMTLFLVAGAIGWKLIMSEQNTHINMRKLEELRDIMGIGCP